MTGILAPFMQIDIFTCLTSPLYVINIPYVLLSLCLYGCSSYFTWILIPYDGTTHTPGYSSQPTWAQTEWFLCGVTCLNQLVLLYLVPTCGHSA